MQKSIAIIGPTASGKTRLSIDIARNYGLNIVNCDSRQFWPIKVLSCSPSDQEKHMANHYIFNCLKPDFVPNLGWWINEIKQIDNKLIVGGNGFYVKNLQKGVPLIEISDKTIQKVNNIDDKFGYLKSLDPDCKIHYNDTYRVLRKLEFLIETGKNFEDYSEKYAENLFIIMVLPDLETIEKNIIERTEQFLDDAIFEIEHIGFYKNFQTIIGYKEIWQYINGDINRKTLLDNIIKQTIKYAKSQIKFFKTMKIDVLCNNINNFDYKVLKNNRDF